MKTNFPILFLISCFILSIGCKSGKKAYQKGNYEDAVYEALDRLKKAPNNNRAREALQQAYPTLTRFYESNINQLSLSNDPMRWEDIYGMYETLQDIHQEVQRTPAAQSVVMAKNYSSELESTKQQIIKVRFDLGKAELAKGYRENAKLAYDHFFRVYELDPQRGDAEDLMYEAQKLATIYIEVMPIPSHLRTFELSSQFFENQIVEFVRNETPNPFVQFVTSKEVKQNRIKPNHRLTLAFDDFVVGQGYEKETVLERSKDSVVVGTATVKDTTVNTYATVKAKVHKFVRTIKSSGQLNLNIQDLSTKATLTQRKFPGTYSYTDQWGFFNGDKRALTKDDKELIKRNKRLPDPPPQDLFVEFTKPIFSQVTRYLKDYYADF